MNAPAGLDPASISERIQSEVQRAIQRSIKGVEYIASSGPSLGSTPKDILHVRGTMSLYHYRPMVDEIYRIPILIVMATTNRGYILDMVPGQSFIEFLLKRGYDVYMLDWSAPKPEEKRLGMEDYVLDFIPHCIRRVQDRHLDVSEIGGATADRHGVIVKLVVPHQVFGDGAEVFTGQRQDVVGPAVKHSIRIDIFVIPDVVPQLHLTCDA